MANVSALEFEDGFRTLRSRRASSPSLNSPVVSVRLHPVVLQAVHANWRDGEQLVIVDEFTARLVPEPHPLSWGKP